MEQQEFKNIIERNIMISPGEVKVNVNRLKQLRRTMGMSRYQKEKLDKLIRTYGDQK